MIACFRRRVLGQFLALLAFKYLEGGLSGAYGPETLNPKP